MLSFSRDEDKAPTVLRREGEGPLCDIRDLRYYCYKGAPE